MRRFVLIMSVLAMVGLSGCATKPLDDFTPAGTLHYSHQNDVYVGDFTYSAMQTMGMRSDQIENTAIGNFYLGVSVADLVRKATVVELQNAGMLIKSEANLIVVGDVTNFKASDIGFTVDWTYGITYSIKQRNTGETLFSRHYDTPMMTTRKMFMSQATAVGFVQKMISTSCVLFIQDPEARSILDAAPADVIDPGVEP